MLIYKIVMMVITSVILVANILIDDDMEQKVAMNVLFMAYLIYLILS